MNKKQANLCFHYSERVKSNLFLISSILERVILLKGERLEGGKEVMGVVLKALRNELNIAGHYLPRAEMDPIKAKLLELEGDIDLYNYERARKNLAELFSSVTTLSNRYIDVLVEEGLI